MSKRTLILIGALIVLTVGLVAIAILPSRKTGLQKTNPTPALKEQAVSPEENQKTTLFISPNPLILSSTSGSLNVEIDSKNKVSAVQLEISYDPNILTVNDISTPKGSFLENSIQLFKAIDKKNGRISYALGLPGAVEAKEGTGIVATVRFTVNDFSKGETVISLLPKTLVTAEGIDTSVLKSATGATIIFPAPSSKLAQ